LTGFAKFDISGPDAESFLNRIIANKAPRKLGGIGLVHTLSPQGRILGEMTLSRLGEDRYFALSAAAAEQRDLDLMRQSLRPGEKVTITNVTEQYGVIVLSGPRSREVLGALTDADLGNDSSPGCAPAKSPWRVNPYGRCA
jgi:dimethylglycine dehydrogenase